MADQDSKMVLRTVYLPPDLDNQLRVRAFREKKTKNDLIRDAVALWLKSEVVPVAAQNPRAARAVSAVSRSNAAATRKTASAKS